MVSDCLNRDNPLNPPYQGDRICRIGEVVRSGILTGIFMIFVIFRIGGLSEAGFTGLKEVGNRSSLLQKSGQQSASVGNRGVFAWAFPPSYRRIGVRNPSHKRYTHSGISQKEVGNRSSLLQKITYFFIVKTTEIRGFRPSRK